MRWCLDYNVGFEYDLLALFLRHDFYIANLKKRTERETFKIITQLLCDIIIDYNWFYIIHKNHIINVMHKYQNSYYVYEEKLAQYLEGHHDGLWPESNPSRKLDESKSKDVL